MGTTIRRSKKGTNVKPQKLKTGDHVVLGTAVFKWLLSARSQNLPFIIQEKVAQFAKELKIGNWLATPQEGQKLYNIQNFDGEWSSVTTDMVNEWSETSFPTRLSNYILKHIYNADELGLLSMPFGHKLPTKIGEVFRRKVN